MAELVFDCVDVRSDQYAAGPTLNFTLRVAETTGERGACHRAALPVAHRAAQAPVLTAEEAQQLNDLFGDTSRWADTLKPVQFAMASVMVPSFTGSVEVDLAVPCTYDLDIASTRYFHALEDGEIPLLLLFSGTLFTRGTTGFSVDPGALAQGGDLPPAGQRMAGDDGPVLPRQRLAAAEPRRRCTQLGAFKNARALPTWEQTIDRAARTRQPSRRPAMTTPFDDVEQGRRRGPLRGLRPVPVPGVVEQEPDPVAVRRADAARLRRLRPVRALAVPRPRSSSRPEPDAALTVQLRFLHVAAPRWR